MSKDLNKWQGIGRTTRQPDLRKTPQNKSVTDITIAVNGYKEGDVSFIKCVAWDKAAELICQYVGKGHRIYIEGRLNQSHWEDKDGKKRESFEVTVESFQFLQPKGEGQPVADERPEPKSKGDLSGTNLNFDKPFSDDDIPFAPNVC